MAAVGITGIVSCGAGVFVEPSKPVRVAKDLYGRPLPPRGHGGATAAALTLPAAEATNEPEVRDVLAAKAEARLEQQPPPLSPPLEPAASVVLPTPEPEPQPSQYVAAGAADPTDVGGGPTVPVVVGDTEELVAQPAVESPALKEEVDAPAAVDPAAVDAPAESAADVNGWQQDDDEPTSLSGLMQRQEQSPVGAGGSFMPAAAAVPAAADVPAVGNYGERRRIELELKRQGAERKRQRWEQEKAK